MPSYTCEDTGAVEEIVEGIVAEIESRNDLNEYAGEQDIMNGIMENSSIIDLEGVEYQAYHAHKQMKELKPYYNNLGREKTVNEAHAFYDRVYRCRGHNSHFQMENMDPNDKCDDHPFSARVVFRVLMDDWPPFMDNFDDFKEEFKKIYKTLRLTKQANQDVKVKPDGNGEIIVPKLITERYMDMVFIHRRTGERVEGFPLDIPEWYLAGERKRLCSR